MSAARIPVKSLSLLAIGVAAGLLVVVPEGASAGVDPSTTLQQWGPKRVVTSDTRISGGGVDGPTVVVTPSGTAVAMWLEQRPSRPPRVMVSQRRAGHRNWQPKQMLARGFFGAIEAHGRNRVTVAWQSGDARYAEISVQTLRRNGTWGPIQQIARWRDRGGVTVSLLLAANDRGDMAAVWTRAHYIRVAYRPAGSSWREPTTIPVHGAYAYDGMANVSRDGQVDVVFPGPGDTRARDVFAWHRALGGVWSGESLGRLPGQRTFSAAGNPDGDLAVTWMTRDNRNDPRRVVLRYRSSGGTFTQPETLATDAKLPQLDIAHSGVVTVAWLARVDDLARVDLARRLLDGSYSATQRLAQRPFNRYYGPLLGVDVNARGDGVVHRLAGTGMTAVVSSTTTACSVAQRTPPAVTPSGSLVRHRTRICLSPQRRLAEQRRSTRAVVQPSTAPRLACAVDECSRFPELA